MASESLYAPWRMEYIRSLGKGSSSECFLCAAAGAEPARWKELLVLWTTPQTIVLINRFPYTNGHLLIAPRAHVAELEELNAEQLLDMQVQTIKGIDLLRRAMSPQGFNIGMNLGRPAGAGLPGHIHQHIVPRWAGDTNFMSVVGDVRIVPEATNKLYDELMRHVSKAPEP